MMFKGIRFKIVIGLAGLMFLLLAGSFMGLSWHLNRSYTQLEHEASAQDFKRLLTSIDARLRQIEKLRQEWSNWTAMMDYVEGRTPEFAAAELGAESLMQSGIAAVGVLGLEGRPIYEVSIPGAPEMATLFKSDYGPMLSRLPVASEPACGLLFWSGQRWVVCRLGIYQSSGQGQAAGILVTVESLSAELLQEIKAQTGLGFVLRPEQLSPSKSVADAPKLRSSLGSAEVVYDIQKNLMRLSWPVQDMAKKNAGYIEMEWPRRLSSQARDDLASIRWQLIVFFAVMALGFLFILDRLVIRRLVGFGVQLRAINQASNWQKQIEVDGDDEITTLANDTNQVLRIISQQLDNLNFLAETDVLTDLPNRRKFERVLQHALHTAARNQRSLCLILLDVDHFKAYNDHYGHTLGDAALQVVAACLKEHANRPGDLPARIGGEEFAVVLEDTDLAGATHWAKKTQNALAQRAVAHALSTSSDFLAFSAGLVAAQPGDTLATLYSRADQALYRAKRLGRNRIEVDGAVHPV